MLKNSLWHLAPAIAKYDSRIWHYGTGRFKYQVPGINCPNCGPGGGGNAKLHLIDCPNSIRKELEAYQENSPCLAPSDFARLKKRWESALASLNYTQGIDPGDSFPPFLWTIPTVPRYSFFWLFFETIIRGELVQKLIKANVSGFVALNVELCRVGAFESQDAIPESLMNICNELEDIVELAPPLHDSANLDTFFCFTVNCDSKSLWMREIKTELTVCEACGRVTVPNSVVIESRKLRSHLRRRNEIPSRYCFDSDVFRSHLYEDGFVISRRVLELLSEQDLQNCAIRKLSIV